MPEMFVDTSGWAAFLVRADPMHAVADAYVRQWRKARTRVVTTNCVFAELAALLTSPMRVPRPNQITILRTLRRAPWIEVVHIDPLLDEDAWSLFDARPDKEWSLVDCSSFVLMQRRGIIEALATDHHFEQAGFVPLLKS